MEVGSKTQRQSCVIGRMLHGMERTQKRRTYFEGAASVVLLRGRITALVVLLGAVTRVLPLPSVAQPPRERHGRGRRPDLEHPLPVVGPLLAASPAAAASRELHAVVEQRAP